MSIRAIADSIARCSLIVLFGGVAIFIIPAPWGDGATAKTLFISVLLFSAMIAWLVARLSEGVVHIPRNALLLSAVFLPLAYLISAIGSHAPTSSYVTGFGSQDTVAMMALLFLALFLAAVVFGARGYTEANRAAPILLRALFFGATIAVAVQVARLFAPSWLSFNGALAGSASSVVGSWHDLGIYLALVILFISLAWSSPQIARGYMRVLLVTLALVAFLLLLVIDLQDVWYLLAGISLSASVMQWGSARFYEHRRFSDALWRGAVSFLVGVIALASAFGGALLVSHLPVALQVTQNEVRPSWQGTFAVGQHVFRGSGLIFGAGPNTFTRAWGLFKPVGVNLTPFWSTDFSSGVGLVPTSLVSAGVLGALAWFMIVLTLFLQTLMFLRGGRIVRERALSGALLLGAWLLLVVHMIYVPGLALSIELFLLLGAFLAAAETDRRPFTIFLNFRSRTAVLATIVLLSSTLVFGAASVWEARAAVADTIVRFSADRFSHDNDTTTALSLIQKALVVYPENDAARRAAVELGLVQFQRLLQAGKSANSADLQTALSQTISQGLQAVSINSGDYQNWLSLAYLYQSLGGAGVSGAYDNALSAYQKAALQNPTNPLPLLGAAQVAATQGNATSSLAYASQAIALKQDFAAAYFVRSQVEARQGDLIEATVDAKHVVSLAQQDPLGWYNLGAVLYASGNYTDAVQALEQAVSLNNTYANAIFILSLAREKAGDHQGAITAMQQVVLLNPNDATAARVLDNLQHKKTPLLPAHSAQ